MTVAAVENLAVSTQCAHCGLDVPSGLIEPDVAEQFCCAGCRSVYQALHACGLQAYYRLREVAGTPAKPSESKFEAFDTPALHKLYVQRQSETVASVDLLLEGVTCAACVWLIERLPRVLPGVIEARLSLRQAVVRVTWNDQTLTLSKIARTLNRIGYLPHPARGLRRKDVFRREERSRLVTLAAAGALAGNAMLVGFALHAARFAHMEEPYREFFRWISAIFGLLSLTWPGATFFRGALAALRMRRINLDVPIVLALLVGGIAGTINVFLQRGEIYFDSLSVLVFLLLIGRFLQFRQQRSADDAVELLFSLAPSVCRLIRETDTEGEPPAIDEVPIEAVNPGDLIEARSGDIIPADGIVESGRSSVLAALLTGESLPAPVAPGSEVFGGSRNQGAALRIRVHSVGCNSRVGKLMSVVERGIGEKPAIVQLDDRVGAWFVVIVSLSAITTFLWWSRVGLPLAIDHAVALLIVTCPCALGLVTPLTISMAIGRLARCNILVKSGAAIEKLAGCGQILLDKTGTLTYGRMRLVCWEGPDHVKPLVAELEKQSQHPIARALVEGLPISPGITFSKIIDLGDGGISAQYQEQTFRVGSPAFIARSGVCISNALLRQQQELESTGLTVVLISLDSNAVALAALGDQLRQDSTAAVDTLRTLDWRPQILSGDAQPVVNAIAKLVHIDAADALGQQTPEDKLATVRHCRHSGPVIMIGDGVNDAAALAAADVGIAVHGGAEASLAAADVYVATPGMSSVVPLFRAARQTMRAVRRNLIISLAYNLVAGTLAATGHMNPLVAAILMPISSATVLFLAAASVQQIGRTPILQETTP